MDSEFVGMQPEPKDPEFTDDQQKAVIHPAMTALEFTEVGSLQYKKDPLMLLVGLKGVFLKLFHSLLKK